MLRAMRRASSLVRRLAAARRPGLRHWLHPRDECQKSLTVNAQLTLSTAPARSATAASASAMMRAAGHVYGFEAVAWRALDKTGQPRA